MDLSLDPTLGLRYKSLPQKVRVITERWGEANLFCPACPAESLNSLPLSTRVEDYRCGRCDARFQLKCKKGRFGQSVTNSAFRAKMDAVQGGRAPHYLFLSYAEPEWVVTDLFAVPGYFFTPAVIQQRPPLHPNAPPVWLGGVQHSAWRAANGRPHSRGRSGEGAAGGASARRLGPGCVPRRRGERSGRLGRRCPDLRERPTALNGLRRLFASRLLPRLRGPVGGAPS